MFFKRGKNKIQNAYHLPDTYKYYINLIEDDSPFNITWSTYKSIVIDYLKEVIESIFDGEVFVIPARLGSVWIRKKKLDYNKPGLLSINWKESNRLGKRVYHLDEHSNGYRHRFYWSRCGITTNNSRLYQMIMTRANKRRLAKILNSGERSYIELKSK